MVPANPQGIYKGREVTLADHVLGSYRPGRKSNSPFTSFTYDAGTATAWAPQTGNVLKLKLDELEQAIETGELIGVSVHRKADILKSLMAEPPTNFRQRGIKFVNSQNEVLVRGIVPARFLN